MTTLNYTNSAIVIVLPPFYLGQLIREDNGLRNYTYIYAYDNAGNITSKKTYALTATGTTPTSLSSYTFSWTGRQLTGATKNNRVFSFSYNDEGISKKSTKSAFPNGNSGIGNFGNKLFSLLWNDIAQIKNSVLQEMML